MGRADPQRARILRCSRGGFPPSALRNRGWGIGCRALGERTRSRSSSRRERLEKGPPSIREIRRTHYRNRAELLESVCRNLIVTIKGPQSLRGTVTAPGSKAYTHRALLASLLSRGETIIEGASECDDVHWTLEGIRSLGAKVRIQNSRIVSVGRERSALCANPIECGESGATLRFLTAIAGTSPTRTALRASKRLAERPL